NEGCCALACEAACWGDLRRHEWQRQKYGECCILLLELRPETASVRQRDSADEHEAEHISRNVLLGAAGCEQRPEGLPEPLEGQQATEVAHTEQPLPVDGANRDADRIALGCAPDDVFDKPVNCLLQALRIGDDAWHFTGNR